jgi:aspartate racemase
MQTVGILGGMGPEASVRFLELLVRNTAAAVDQDHVPDASLELSPDPGPDGGPFARWRESRSVAGARRGDADGGGRGFSGHAVRHGAWLLATVAPQIRLPLVHLLHAALDDLRSAQADIKTIGLLATHGTVQTRVVHDVFEPAGIQMLLPSDSDQARVMEAIYGREGIKAGVTTGHPRAVVCEIALQLIQAGAEAILAGCTEIPLVLKSNGSDGTAH